jgi:hypothetical protein
MSASTCAITVPALTVASAANPAAYCQILFEKTGSETSPAVKPSYWNEPVDSSFYDNYDTEFDSPESIEAYGWGSRLLNEKLSLERNGRNIQLMRENLAATQSQRNKDETALSKTTKSPPFSFNLIAWSTGMTYTCGLQTTTVTISCGKGGSIAVIPRFGVSGCYSVSKNTQKCTSAAKTLTSVVAAGCVGAYNATAYLPNLNFSCDKFGVNFAAQYVTLLQRENTMSSCTTTSVELVQICGRWMEPQDA